MFLSANDFFWRVVRRRTRITRVERWRDLGRPESALVGAAVPRQRSRAAQELWIIRDAAAAPWLFEGSGLASGSRFGRGGIEIDATTPSSPPGIHVLAEIPRRFGKQFTAQMTYYETPAGAEGLCRGRVQPRRVGTRA